MLPRSTHLSATKWTVILFLPWIIGSTASCPGNLLAMYRVILHTEWSVERFPKHYPEWRPPAQWSVLIGRSHNATYHLWQMGKTASDALKQYTETGKVDLLIREGSADKRGILSEFFGPPITQGVGRTETKFFVDGNHSKVSFVCRVVPSPDWFIGVDSLDLCVGHKWLDSVTLDLDPVDAGTDNGFTFTSPKWATEPRAKISAISSRFPSHPANSFFYPEAKKLPRIAYITFLKQKEFVLSQQLVRDKTEVKNVEKPIPEERRIVEVRMNPVTVKVAEDIPAKPQKKKGEPSYLNSLQPEEENDPTILKMRRKMRKQKEKKNRGPRQCKVSEWSEWGACSKTCGFGEETRSRKVMKHAARGGLPCPPLLETRWCGSARTCRNESSSYFRW